MSKPRFRLVGGFWMCRYKTHKTCSTYEEKYIFVFTYQQMTVMLANYKLGNCPITDKGMFRYCDAYVPDSRQLSLSINPTLLRRLHWRC